MDTAWDTEIQAPGWWAAQPKLRRAEVSRREVPGEKNIMMVETSDLMMPLKY